MSILFKIPSNPSKSYEDSKACGGGVWGWREQMAKMPSQLSKEFNIIKVCHTQIG